MQISIGKQQDGRSVLEILKKDLTLSSRLITFLKSNETGILLNGVRVTVRAKVKHGDILSIDYKDSPEICNSSVIPTELPIDVIYEDDDIIAVNKPADMPTHPSLNHYADTLANALTYYFRSNESPFVFRAISRLDNGTSGIVLVAKNRLSALRLSRSMACGKIKKEYFAVLDGRITPAEGIINRAIKRKGESLIERVCCDEADEGARSAITEYRTVMSNNLFSAVLTRPVTGRTHQLRVHFSSMGAGICGDTLYGYPSEFISHQALHAYSLSFTHPTTNEPMLLTAPIPNDIKQLCENAFGVRDIKLNQER